jgi:hypothetical protein
MTKVFNDCLGKTKEQMFDYCIENNVDIETVFAIGEKAENEIPSLERELTELQDCYSYDSETGCYYASHYTRSIEDNIENEIASLKALRDNAEEVYSMLDDYYYNRQTF